MSKDLRIGGKLKMLREFRNLKQDAVAKELGISPTAYSRIEQNQSKLEIGMAQKLSELFEVSLPDLISNENPIISFNYSDSVKVETGYVNHNYEMSKEALMAIMQSKDNEIELLKEQIKAQQEQIGRLTAILGDQLSALKK